MGKVILIVWFSSYSSNTSFTMQEFNTFATCEAAKAVVMEHNRYGNAQCVEK